MTPRTAAQQDAADRIYGLHRHLRPDDIECKPCPVCGVSGEIIEDGIRAECDECGGNGAVPA